MVLRFACRVIVKNEDQFKKIFKCYPINEIGRLGCRIALETIKIIDVSLLYVRSEGLHRSKKLIKRMKSKVIEEYNIAKEEHRQSTGKHILNSVISKHIKYAFINVYKHRPLYNNKITSSFLYEPKKRTAVFIYKKKLGQSKPSIRDTVLSYILNKIFTKCQQYLPNHIDNSLMMPVALTQQYKKSPISSKLLIVPADLCSISLSLTEDSGVNYNYLQNGPKLATINHKISPDYFSNKLDVLKNTKQLLSHKKLENVVFHHIKSANLYKPKNTKMSDPKNTTKQITTLKTDAVVTNLCSRPSWPREEISNIFNENRYKYYNTEQQTISRNSPEREKQSFEKDYKKKLEWVTIEKKDEKEIRLQSTQMKIPRTNQKIDSICFSKPGLVPIHHSYELPDLKSAEAECVNEFEKKLDAQKCDNYCRSSVNSPRLKIHSKEKISKVLRNPTPTTSLRLCVTLKNNNKKNSSTKVSEEISAVKARMPTDFIHTNTESPLGLYFGQKKDNVCFNVKSLEVISQEKQIAHSDAKLFQNEESMPSNGTKSLEKSEEQQIPFNDVRYNRPESSLGLHSSQRENEVDSNVRLSDDRSEIEEKTSHVTRYKPEFSLGLNSSHLGDDIHAHIKQPEVRSDTNESSSNNVSFEITESTTTNDEKNIITNATSSQNDLNQKEPKTSLQKEDNLCSEVKSLQVIHSDADKIIFNNSADMSSYTRPKSPLELYSDAELLQNYLPICFLKIGSELKPDTSSVPSLKAIQTIDSITELNKNNIGDKNSTSFWPDLWMNQTNQTQLDESYGSDFKAPTNSTKSAKKEENDEKKLS